MEMCWRRVTALGLLAIVILTCSEAEAAKKSPPPAPSSPAPSPPEPFRRARLPRPPPLQPTPQSPSAAPRSSPLPSSASGTPPSSPPPSPSPRSPSPSPPSPPPPSPRPPSNKQPNFVVILVDDQDYLLNSTHRAYMPKLHKYIGDQGLHLNNFIVTSSLCCPSRVSLLTGRYTHNHNVTSNQAPQGWVKFSALGLDRDWLPQWLKPLGYNTYFTGKFINLFDVQAGETSKCPRGWDLFDPLTDKTVYDYVNYDFMPQCAKLDSFRDNYQTETITQRALGYIDDAVGKGSPFYLQINPAACHTACPKGAEDGGSCVPPVPAPKYAGRFSSVSAPRTSNWGVMLPNVLGIGPDSDSQSKSVDKHYQRRLETMLSVDDMIEALVGKLEQQGILDNTYVVYVSDNGYHLGNHALAKGKTLPYEEDIRVPFYMRGPGIPAASSSPYMATIVDLTSTFVQLGGGVPPDRLDGIPLPLDRILSGAAATAATAAASQSSSGSTAAAATGATAAAAAAAGKNFPVTNGTLRQMLPVEMWINSLSKELDKKDYRAVRICTNTSLLKSSSSTPSLSSNSSSSYTSAICWKYTIWCVWPTTTNYKELFDLTSDPGEIKNLMVALDLNPNAAFLKRLINRLDALLQVMGYCKGLTCKAPWLKLHPEGGVDSIEAAMNSVYDGKYESYTKYAWKSCQQIYDPVNNEVADRALGGVSKWVTSSPSPSPAATSG